MSFFTIRDIGMFLGNGSKYLFVLCFRVLSNQYFDRSAYANAFKLNREKKRGSNMASPY